MLHLEASIVGKWLAMLKEIAPLLSRAALMGNRKTATLDYFLQSAQTVAPSLAVELVASHVETAADIERAIESFARVSDIGLVLPPDATTIAHRDLVITLAARHRLPAVYPVQLFVVGGGLMSYGTDQNDMFRLARWYRPASSSWRSYAAKHLIAYGADRADIFGLAASYVDRILRGDKPADLTVQAPTKFETAVNLRTAKALGLTVPPGLLVAADEVIE